MENAILEKRVERCEDDIKELSREVTENTTNMEHTQKIVDDFSKFINENIKTLTNIQDEIKSLNKSQECFQVSFEKKLGDIKEKVDQNEEFNKVDIRPIQKKNYENTIIKISMITTPLLILGFFLYLFLK